MENENSEAAQEAKGMWHNPDRVLAEWRFTESAEYPHRTAEEAEKHVREYISGNEFITDTELIDSGFVKKESGE